MRLVNREGGGTSGMNALLKRGVAGSRPGRLPGNCGPGHRLATFVRNPDRKPSLRVERASDTLHSRRDLIIRSDNWNSKSPAALADESPGGTGMGRK
jgi:hypothetical protein